jgi:hypothetical protein
VRVACAFVILLHRPLSTYHCNQFNPSATPVITRASRRQCFRNLDRHWSPLHPLDGPVPWTSLQPPERALQTLPITPAVLRPPLRHGTLFPSQTQHQLSQTWPAFASYRLAAANARLAQLRQGTPVRRPKTANFKQCHLVEAGLISKNG